MVVVTEFMDFTWSYITDCLQKVKFLIIFKDFDVQAKDLWSEDNDLRSEDKYKDL